MLRNLEICVFMSFEFTEHWKLQLWSQKKNRTKYGSPLTQPYDCLLPIQKHSISANQKNRCCLYHVKSRVTVGKLTITCHLKNVLDPNLLIDTMFVSLSYARMQQITGPHRHISPQNKWWLALFTMRL